MTPLSCGSVSTADTGYWILYYVLTNNIQHVTADVQQPDAEVV